MALTGEHMVVDGRTFRILPFDVERVNSNMHEGAPHVWHGVEVVSDGQEPQSGLFASATIRHSRVSGLFPQIKEITTHKIG